MSVHRSWKNLFSTYLTPKVMINSQKRLYPHKSGTSLECIILDLSGTTMDPYVLAPIKAFKTAFQSEGVTNITGEDIRKPMGLRIDLHVRKILETPSIYKKFSEVKGRPPTTEDALRISKAFDPVYKQSLKDFSDLIPGTLEAVKCLKDEYKLKLGLTSGFQRDVLDLVLEEARSQGLDFYCTVSCDEISNDMGFKPSPFMLFKNLEKMKIYDRRVVLKVDDTVAGINEGLNAGVWTVGVFKYSGLTNIESSEELQGLSGEEITVREEKAKAVLAKSGAHFVAESIDDIPDIVEEINRRMKNGEEP